MNTTHDLWLELRPVVYAVVFYLVFLKEPFGRWLQKGFLRDGWVALWQCRLFNVLQKLRLVPPITLPSLRLAELTSSSLPKGLEICPFAPKHIEACLAIYRLNAPNRFPEEVEREFVMLLEKDHSSMLVVQQHGRVIACGGVQQHGTHSVLCYGLIHPEYQNQGIGRLLLVMRLARLEVSRPICVQIHAVEASIGYYERLGFARYARWYSQDGKAHPSAGASLHPEEHQKIAKFLINEGYQVLPALRSPAEVAGIDKLSVPQTEG